MVPREPSVSARDGPFVSRNQLPLLRVLINSSCSAEKDYALSVLLGEFLGISYEVQVDPGAADGIAITDGIRSFHTSGEIFAQLARNWGQKLSIGQNDIRHLDVSRWLPQLPFDQVPVLTGAPHIAEAEDGISVEFDLFGTVFLFLSFYG